MRLVKTIVDAVSDFEEIEVTTLPSLRLLYTHPHPHPPPRARARAHTHPHPRARARAREFAFVVCCLGRMFVCINPTSLLSCCFYLG
jgi:hypothetical protein